MTTNNNNIIIYNNFSCAEPAQQEEEKKNFYKIFFFKNAADPAAEVERFVAFNEAHGWANNEGKPYDTPDKRLGLAGFWEFKAEGHWARPEYLKAVKAIYDEAIQENIEGVEVLIDHRVNLSWNGRERKWEWSSTQAAYQWIQENFELVKKHIKPMLGQETAVIYKKIA